jgi:thiol-disulfide isomerase/thioredoxin
MLPKVPPVSDVVVRHPVDARVHPLMEKDWQAGKYSRPAMPLLLRRTCGLLLLCVLAVAPMAARRAPDPSLKSLDGQTRKLSALRGKMVVVNFWATWCGPCQEELPRLAQIAESYAGKPVEFVLISIDAPKDRSKIPAVLERLHVTRESWVGGDTDLMDRFGLGNIVPGTAVIDDHGEVVARIMGEAQEDDIRRAVDWLLSGRSGPPAPELTKRY